MRFLQKKLRDIFKRRCADFCDEDTIAASFVLCAASILFMGFAAFQRRGGLVMCEAVERYAEQKAEKVRLNSMLESIKNLMESMKWSAEQAMNVLEVNDHDREILLKRL